MDQELILFIEFIAAILSIVLFFKIWGMTNNIKKIKSRYINSNDLKLAQIEFLKGNKSKAKDLLDNTLFSVITDLKNSSDQSQYDKKINFIINNLADQYQKMELEMPNIENIRSFSKISELL